MASFVVALRLCRLNKRGSSLRFRFTILLLESVCARPTRENAIVERCFRTLTSVANIFYYYAYFFKEYGIYLKAATTKNVTS